METTRIKKITWRMLFALGLGLTLFVLVASAQIEPNAGQWKTWVLSSGSQFRLPEPPSQRDSKEEVEVLANLATQRATNALELVKLWDAGSPSYQWNQIALSEISKFNLNTPRGERVLALVNVAIYDAMAPACVSNSAYHLPRPNTPRKH